MGTRLGPNGHWSISADKLGQRRGSVDKGATAAGRKRAREEGEQTQNLTVEATGWSAGSRTSRRRQTGPGDLGGREVEDDGDDVAMARPGSLGSVEMTKMTSWSS